MMPQPLYEVIAAADGIDEKEQTPVFPATTLTLNRTKQMRLTLF